MEKRDIEKFKAALKGIELNEEGENGVADNNNQEKKDNLIAGPRGLEEMEIITDIEQCEPVECSNPENVKSYDAIEDIFSSEGEEDLQEMIRENETIKNALIRLKKEQDFWLTTDSASETSDDADTIISSRSFIESTAERIQINKLLAEKEYLELKLSQVTHDKDDTEVRLRNLEKKSYKSNWKSNETSPQNMYKGSEARDAKSPKHKPKRREESVYKEALAAMYKAHRRSSSPRFAKGYESDIATLAEENAKLGEIIDHLGLDPDNPKDDSIDALLASFENRVPKDEFLRLENEKIRLEHVLRDRERQLKEKDRIIEENKADYEEDLKSLKELLRKAEEKSKSKMKAINDYEIQILDFKSSFSEQISTLEAALQHEQEQKTRLEELNISLRGDNEAILREVDEMKRALLLAQEREKELEAICSQEVCRLEEKLATETNEKMMLSANFEELVKDLMMLKNKLLEESERNGKLRKAFENEILSLGGVPHTRRMRSNVTTPTRDDLGNWDRVTSPARESIEAVGNWDRVVSPSRDGSKDAGEMERGTPSRDKTGESVGFDAHPSLRDNKDEDPKVEEEYEELKIKYSKLVKELENARGENGVASPHVKQSLYESESMKGKIKDLEDEVRYLKERLEDMAKEKTRRRELEKQIEELQDELDDVSTRRNELQKKQEKIIKENDELNDRINELEKENDYLAKEIKDFANKIKEMETSYEEKERERQTEKAMGQLVEEIDIQKTKNSEMTETASGLKDGVFSAHDADKILKGVHIGESDGKNAKQSPHVRNISNNELPTFRGDSEESRITIMQDSFLQTEPGVEESLDSHDSDPTLREALTIDDTDGKAIQLGARDGYISPRSSYSTEENIPIKPGENDGVGNDTRKESMIPNLTIEVQLQEQVTSNVFAVQQGAAVDDQEFKKMAEEYRNLGLQVGEKQNKINELTERIQDLEGELCHAKEEGRSLSEELEKAVEGAMDIEHDLNDKLEQTSKRYEALLDELTAKLETEKMELQERLTKNNEEMQERMKTEFAEHLASKVASLELKLQDTVAEEVQAYREEIKDFENQLEIEKQRAEQELGVLKEELTKAEKERTETATRAEREKKLLTTTIQALTKELDKVKQQKKEMKKSFKRSKGDLQNSFENERKQFEDSLEKSKEVGKMLAEEVMREKLKNETIKYEERINEMSSQMEAYEMKIEQLQNKFKAEKGELEDLLHESRVEMETLIEKQDEFRDSLDQEYQRKLHIEKQNIESTLESLRQEISRLRDHRKQLQTQLQNNTRSDSIQGLDSLTNKEVITRLEYEYQNQLQRDKKYYEDKIASLEAENETLMEDIFALKTRYRQEKAMMKAEFETERNALEERLDQEREELQEMMGLRMQSFRDSRSTVEVNRSSMTAQRNRVLQNEVQMLQQKVTRLEQLSPELINKARQNQPISMQHLNNQPISVKNLPDQPIGTHNQSFVVHHLSVSRSNTSQQRQMSSSETTSGSIKEKDNVFGTEEDAINMSFPEKDTLVGAYSVESISERRLLDQEDRVSSGEPSSEEEHNSNNETKVVPEETLESDLESSFET